MSRGTSDAGQAFPVYITAVAGLLFLALAFFAVGMASADRNDAQGAADAAALAAAQDARDGLREDLLELFDPDVWEDLLGGGEVGDADGACGAAAEFARKNDAELTGCDPVSFPAGFTVGVRNTEPVGDSLIPGTESTYAEATATAVIEPRCDIGETEVPPNGEPGGEEEDTEEPPGEEEEPEPGHELVCDGIDAPIEIGPDLDPEDLLEILPDPEELFSVHLADQ
ncbi:pilus assembly protein TadG-related protein [Streptomyces sp. TRM 70361]|uniref:pilus assembly protein TadG-related protein n=1 Tax=Streptomyces sp. TRM 70361 TaxID=3116553 RepID=UPI002E7AF0B9|nr:pilus assembly protein TadG-related protein [Streptomyces sp. TRM 70361]MEE1939278.1 pilus assembly protein TadG-related protein [Streptomyces sp. TRM 70361]